MKERSDYGFHGYQVPIVPRGPRSIRKRRPRKKSIEDRKICPFELLAAVAGKLLLESESSASSSAEGRDKFGIHEDGIKFEKLEQQWQDPGSCVESAFLPDSAIRSLYSNSSLADIIHLGDESVLKHTSNTTDVDLSKDIDLDLKLEICTNNSTERDLSDKLKGNFSNDGNLYDGQVKNGNRLVEDKNIHTRDFIAANTGSRDEHRTNYANSNTVINSERSVQFQFPLYRDPIPSASFVKHRNNVTLGTNRDDAENSFRFNKTKIKAFRPQTRFGYRRVRKMLTSKYWKEAPGLKDSELPECLEEMKPFYRRRKRLYSQERCHREAPSKRLKVRDNIVLACDYEARIARTLKSPEKGVERDDNDSTAFLFRAVGPSASLERVQKSMDTRVKLSIKSFKVPELYIEVPETATVGSLKRTVMEAVTTILGGGLDVGVVLEGKKVRDDNRTLQQAGISDSSNLETLGFTLEPSLKTLNQQTPASPKMPLACLSPDANKKSTRSPITPNLELGLHVPSISNNDPPITKMEKPVEDKLELGCPLREKAEAFSDKAEAFSDKAEKDSKALIPIPTMNVESRAVVPLNQRPKRSELSHRRTRRPFSVTEVEALVEAVETLGTGRWRDIKMRAFDSASHRTYVDLKDKWKTLVHTACISPQQRRGEPVPQQLLDRVLCAHGYWSQNQSKQHGKHYVEALRITDGKVERVGA